MADTEQTSMRERVLSQDDAVDQAAMHGDYSGNVRRVPAEPMSAALAAAYRDFGKSGGQQPFADLDR